MFQLSSWLCIKMRVIPCFEQMSKAPALSIIIQFLITTDPRLEPNRKEPVLDPNPLKYLELQLKPKP